jgi:UDP-N-acetyl-D-glucosamine dehydrogenase
MPETIFSESSVISTIDSPAVSTTTNGRFHGPEDSSSNGHFAPLAQQLLTKTADRKAVIGVLGLGYVGLPLATAFASAGFKTFGFDPHRATVDLLQSGQSHIGDVAASTVKKLVDAGTFSATDDFSQLRDCDVAIICVPTPLTNTRDPDMKYIISACEAIKPHVHEGMLVILESTTFPGTTNDVTRPILEENGLVAGKDFFLAFSPERIDPGNEKFPIHKVPKVVGGHTPDCLKVACALYDSIVERTVPVSSTQAAELTKLLENIFRSVNIALVNEMAMLCDRMEIDIWEVIDAASTKPYGYTRFLPGPGLGGHCIPIDPFYLSWKAREFKFQTQFIELAGEINHAMPRFVVNKLMRALNDEGKAIRGSRIGLLGMSYKANVGDCRESPSVEIAELLSELGAELIYHDPFVESVTIDDHVLTSQSLEQTLNTDCVVLLTDHKAYDYNAIASQARLILDTRNAFSKVESSQAKIIKL